MGGVSGLARLALASALAASRSARQSAAASNVISVRVPTLISRGMRLLFLQLVIEALADVVCGAELRDRHRKRRHWLRLAGIGVASFLPVISPRAIGSLHVRSCGVQFTRAK